MTKGKNDKIYKIIAGILFLVFVGFVVAMCLDSSGSTSGSSHRCAICGKTEKTRQITAQAANGKWDDSWYCPEHYADAWQYYYGTGKK